MLISRTPVRASFCGGGTDLAAFYQNHPDGGAVTSLAMARYLYVTVNPRFDNSIRISYSSMEFVDDINEIQHELVREAMKSTGVTHGIEVTTIADIPSRGTGLGSSSAVTIGLLNALSSLAGNPMSSEELAKEACRIEIDVLGQPIGKQDQYAAAIGGANTIGFLPDGSVSIDPLILSDNTKQRIENEFSLVYTGLTRSANSVLSKQKELTADRMEELSILRLQAFQVRSALEGGRLEEVGRLLEESWQIKRNLVDGITGELLDSLHEQLIDAGATGAKLLGAGGGGFFLVHGDTEIKTRLENSLSSKHKILPLLIDSQGSTIIHDDGKRWG
ncbi:MAG: GHMP kinase [Candidatus Thermoplasmatota archaeon]|nr:GHMP kinase [Euryarchaeota archaeon]MEC7042771.1 GHMP kinase [Candidatus Thermoplasmatota archaeon]MEC7142469.1 GHMP kinase [Candidatus Thermoplasmatota archaeon]MEC7390764.1 GHMP kinase [Candidatus Thermoplasmatota archaeon]MEC7462689.1 GHMP kinase [Candidatus Thermoplasmatota archaeon]|tara:strand:+ start:1623 stop:2618 length:996 start_codon:yes stop_codon:yes gene_type:complete